jgi:hypothetical protein
MENVLPPLDRKIGSLLPQHTKHTASRAQVPQNLNHWYAIWQLNQGHSFANIRRDCINRRRNSKIAERQTNIAGFAPRICFCQAKKTNERPGSTQNWGGDEEALGGTAQAHLTKLPFLAPKRQQENSSV